ncbi:hypothetical protein N3K66_006123 [Trichothecium roseum]|uniref:Uncharacterized protein n=1 Tax=Trichothecium roseum TaxID=47278 RepID=A0ACC0UZT9_9HYPO|nr:hypothetical protein N3K66_006123 [Trichothecium roseum]
MPANIVMEIAIRLPLAGRLALSLSCTRLSELLYRAVIEGARSQQQHVQRRRILKDLLSRLERDLGSKYYLCPECTKLHTFRNLPGPGDRRNSDRPLFNPCWDKHAYFKNDFRYWLTWQHGRLVMNRHLHGPEAGLPVTALDLVSHRDWLGAAPSRDWKLTYSARIVRDELVLRVTHELSARSPEKLRGMIRASAHKICPHVQFGLSPDCATAAFDPGPGVVLSQSRYCVGCVTDCFLGLGAAPGRRPWRRFSARVESYHALGSFRDVRDWRWESFAIPLHHVRNAARRDMRIYPQGYAVDLWKEQDQTGEAT